jgi:hypothetical protein
VLLTFSMPAPTCAPFRSYSVIPDWSTLSSNLHLSSKHLHAVPNPLDTLEISSLDGVPRSRRLTKK